MLAAVGVGAPPSRLPVRVMQLSVKIFAMCGSEYGAASAWALIGANANLRVLMHVCVKAVIKAHSLCGWKMVKRERERAS